MKRVRNHIIKFFAAFAMLLVCISSAPGARIKDVANVQGSSSVQIIGYGLVTGLQNTGDNQMTTFTVQSVSNMLKRFGLTVPTTNPRIRNVAAVMVTAAVPTFSKSGQKLDIMVSSIGDASSLQGGVLLMTPVSTSDGSIVGLAQGAVSVGGYDVSSLGSRVGKNTVTSGRVPSGLILDKNIDGQFVQNQKIVIALREPDFTAASNIAAAINTSGIGANSAIAKDAGTVEVTLPTGANQELLNIQNIARIEALEVQTDPAARVVINERTGTVVVGGNVRILPSVIAHGGLEITIQKQVIVTQPAPFTIRPPRPVESAQVKVEEQQSQSTPINVVQAGGAAAPTVQDIANALNLLKVSPRDLIAIFQALKAAGTLQGELIIQ